MQWWNMHQNHEEEVASLLTLPTVSSHIPLGVGRPHRGTSSTPSTPMHRHITPCTDTSPHAGGWACACGLTAKHCEPELLQRGLSLEGSLIGISYRGTLFAELETRAAAPSAVQLLGLSLWIRCFVRQERVQYWNIIVFGPLRKPFQKWNWEKTPDCNHAIKGWITT